MSLRAAVSHFELPARDPARAAAFYRKVFDWVAGERDWGGEPYFTLRAPGPVTPKASAIHGAIQGGVAPAAKLAAEGPMLVIHVEGVALADLLERIEQAGGHAVLAAERIGDEGEFARFRDPEGNLLGLWRSF